MSHHKSFLRITPSIFSAALPPQFFVMAWLGVSAVPLSGQTARPGPEQRLTVQTATPPPAETPAILRGRLPEDRLLAQVTPAQTPSTTPPVATPTPTAPEQTAPPSPDGGTRPGGGTGRRGGFGGGGFGGPPGMGGPNGGGDETFTITGDQVSLQFPNNPVADLLSIYERLTGKTLVKDTNIFEGASISLVTPKPVLKDEAVKLIEATLLTNGYAIVADPDGKSTRILPTRGQGVSSMQFSAGVNFYTSEKDIPEGETLITYFMKLDFLDPTEGQEILANHIGLNVYGRITPVLTPPGLLITESATIVKQLISIRAAIDVGDTGSSLVTKFIPVVYADAGTVAQIIQSTISAQATERETKGIKTVRGEAQPGKGKEGEKPAAERKEEQPRPAQPIFYNGQWVYPPTQGGGTAAPTSQVVADTRLNQILVVATPEDYTYIASLVAEFDKAVNVSIPYERRLKYASAIDVLSALVDLLQDTSTGTTQLPGGGSLQAGGQTLVTTNRSQLLGGRSTTNTRGGSVSSTTAGASGTSADGSATGAATGAGGRADVIQGPQEDNAPVSVLIGKTRLVADPMSNSILVMGKKEDGEKVDALLDRLDQKPAQVYLATVIGQLTLGDGLELGIDYLSKFARSGFTSSKFTQRPDIITNNNISDVRDNLITSAFGPAAGFNVYGEIGDTVEAFVNALETTNRFKVLSRPSVFALNNKKATITSGQKIPYPETTVTNVGGNNNNGSVTSTAAYLDVVLKLEVVPLINANGEVNLTIAQVNDTVVGTQRIEPNDIPIIGTEQLVTSVNVPSGKTVVLGGLISEEKRNDTQGIPYISRLPLVGRIFKDRSDSTTRRELIIFIQPVVVTDEPSVDRASFNEDIRTRVGADAFSRFPQTPSPRPPEEAFDPVKKGNFFSRLFSRPAQRATDQP